MAMGRNTKRGCPSMVVDYPGNPVFKNGKMTSNATGNLKTFSSNELAFLSVLFLAIGLHGNIQFNYTDPQWVNVDIGENFNISYIVESPFLADQLLHAHRCLHPETKRQVTAVHLR